MDAAQTTESSTRRQADMALRHSWLHRFFLAGVMLKGVNGCLGLGGGIFVLAATPHALEAISDFATDLLGPFAGEHLGRLVHNPTSLNLLAGYLITKGIIKLFLTAGLLRRWLWSYPTAVVVSGLLIAAEGWRLVLHFSWGLVILMVIDIAINVVIWREYRRLKALRALP